MFVGTLLLESKILPDTAYQKQQVSIGRHFCRILNLPLIKFFIMERTELFMKYSIIASRKRSSSGLKQKTTTWLLVFKRELGVMKSGRRYVR